MPRLLAAALTLCALNISWLVPRAHAAVPISDHVVRVIVQLKGQPMATNSNLRDRSRWTHWRNHIDTSLATTRSYESALRSYQDAEASYIRSKGIDFKVMRNLGVLFNGMAATLPSSQLSRLSKLQNVTAVLPDRKVYPNLDRSLPLVKVPQAWSVLGGASKAGRGIFIADIDTGIDISNPCFKQDGFSLPPLVNRRSDNADNLQYTNNKVIVAKAFGPDQTAAYSAQDTQGHGSFTAAIEACDANTPTPLGTTISGVAPGAYLMNYNVFPDTSLHPDGFNDTIAAALDAAVLDGADVANMSLGYPFQVGDPSLDYDVLRTDLATIAGTVVVVSAGNAGPTPQSISSPSTAPLAISVGSTTNSRTVESQIEIAGSAGLPATLQRLQSSQGSRPFSTLQGPLQMVYVGLARRPLDDPNNPKADDLAGKDLTGKFALIDRGLLNFENKLKNVEIAGAKGAILVDNRFEIGVPGFDVKTATLPVMMVSQKDGEALKAWVASHPETTATLDPVKIQVEETPNYLSDFSARGYGPNYEIKPDLVAPGQFIYSAAEKIKPGGDLYDPSGFAEADGTSFSAPHVTGITALLEQKHLGQSGWTPVTIKAVLMETSATRVVNDPQGGTPGVMDVGAGLVNADAAVLAGADAIPYSISLGQVNVASGAQTKTVSLALNDLGGGSGAWKLSVDQLHTAPGMAVSVPPSVSLDAAGHTNISVQFSIGGSTAPGDYDGYIVLDRGDQTLHVPYFAHVMSKSVTPGSVLLVDSTTSRYQADPSVPPIQRLNVTNYFEDALNAIHRPFTYWDDSVLGAPSLADMQQASAVLYFTGRNLNAFAHENRDFQALLGPMNSLDVANLHAYLKGGGRVFVTGMAASLTDINWTGLILGGNVAGLSTYDNDTNDKNALGGISPPQPSAIPDVRAGVRSNPQLFAGMKLDFSTKGDGAKDNLAVSSDATAASLANNAQSERMVGVTGLQPLAYAGDSFYPASFGKAALQTTDLGHSEGADVAIVNSDDPTLKHAASYKGRSVLFSFSFEGINDNTGFATRAQVLQRVFAWLDDKAAAQVSAASYRSHTRAALKAALTGATGLTVAGYQWQVNGNTLKPTVKPTTYTFPRPGSYRLRVLLTDSLGHSEVSAVKTIHVK
jgi:minor extracellular serine protease Vpr